MNNSSINSTNQSVQCKYKKTAKLTCITKNCIVYAYVCDDYECKCRKQHPKCLITQISSIQNNLSDNKINTQPLQNIINQTIDKMIDYLSDERDNILINIKNKFQFFGLSQNSKDFLQSLNQQLSQKQKQKPGQSLINGNKLWYVIHNIQQKQLFTQSLNQSIKLISNLYQQFLPRLNKFCQNIYSQIQNLNTFIQLKAQENQKYNLNQFPIKKYSPSICDIIKNSKIITLKQQQQVLISFFDNKKIKFASLVYRASQNNFQTKKFHQKCDNMPNTLTLCQTQFNKKIGGYTPLRWINSYGQYKIDSNRQSFIFSVTQKDKLELQKNNAQYTVYNLSTLGPTFGGGHDLMISNKSNENIDSYANIHHTYVNNKYRYNDKESMRKFCGNSQGEYKFRIKQWQVWQIQFY